uniref:tRNA (Guanosine(46)-N7)-methyltransferase TrmB n=2 Tax=Bursaphelenchus xylophilus TaxID=6326 RepID=A0A1I7SJ31_BURXY
YRRFYPQIYHQRFPEENHPLLKRLRNLFPRLNEKLMS